MHSDTIARKIIINYISMLNKYIVDLFKHLTDMDKFIKLCIV